MSDEVKRLELKAEELLLLEQPTLRIPYALSRQQFKTAQRALEHEVPKLLKEYSTIQKASVTASDIPEQGDTEKGDTQGDVEMAEATEDITSASSTDPSAVLVQIDAMLAKLRALKDNLSGLHAKEQKATQASKARLKHLQNLYDFNSLTDVRYECWSKTRLARLEVDYLLREGYVKTAQVLSDKCGIGELVDIDHFVDAGVIERSLREKHDPELALKWCKENAQQLKKVIQADKALEGDHHNCTAADVLRHHESRSKDELAQRRHNSEPKNELALGLMKKHGLEFELRLQQCIEMARRCHDMTLDEDADDYKEKKKRYWALHEQCQAHARKHLISDVHTLGLVSALAALPEGHAVGPSAAYSHYYSEYRWELLAQLFTWTHNTVYNLPQRPMLATALSAGLSALKTPACHSTTKSSSANATTSVCPVCSVELNELARRVPYAHHTKSRVEDDPVALPNGRIYGRERLRAFNKKAGTPKEFVRDPMDGIVGVKDVWPEGLVRKIYIP